MYTMDGSYLQQKQIGDMDIALTVLSTAEKRLSYFDFCTVWSSKMAAHLYQKFSAKGAISFWDSLDDTNRNTYLKLLSSDPAGWGRVEEDFQVVSKTTSPIRFTEAELIMPPPIHNSSDNNPLVVYFKAIESIISKKAAGSNCTYSELIDIRIFYRTKFIGVLSSAAISLCTQIEQYFPVDAAIVANDFKNKTTTE